MTLEEAIEHAQGCVRNDVTSTSGLALIALLEAYNAKQDAQPVAIPDGYEHRKAIQEAEQNTASDGYFKPRTHLMDTMANRNIFKAGYDRGYETGNCDHEIGESGINQEMSFEEIHEAVEYITEIHGYDVRDEHDDMWLKAFVVAVVHHLAIKSDAAASPPPPDSSADAAKPPQLCNFGNEDDFQDALFDYEQEENDRLVGAMQYSGNTVSYMYSKAKNYGDALVEACRLAGGSGHISDRIKALVAERDEAIKRATQPAAIRSAGLTGWRFERKAHGSWQIYSPSGDCAGVVGSDRSILAEVVRQLLQSIDSSPTAAEVRREALDTARIEVADQAINLAAFGDAKTQEDIVWQLQQLKKRLQSAAQDGGDA